MVFLEERSLVFLRLFSRPKRLACLLFLARRAPFSSSYPFSLLKNVSGREDTCPPDRISTTPHPPVPTHVSHAVLRILIFNLPVCRAVPAIGG